MFGGKHKFFDDVQTPCMCKKKAATRTADCKFVTNSRFFWYLMQQASNDNCDGLLMHYMKRYESKHAYKLDRRFLLADFGLYIMMKSRIAIQIFIPFLEVSFLIASDVAMPCKNLN